jgi:hypothetical protein
MGKTRQHPRIAIVVVLACCVAGTIGASAAAGRWAQGPPRISLSVPGQLASGAKLVAKGRVTPTPARGWVVVQFRNEGGWRSLGSTALRDGKFEVSRKLPSELRTTRVRALFFEGKRQLATSTAREVRVRERPQPQPQPAPLPPAPPMPRSKIPFPKPR